MYFASLDHDTRSNLGLLLFLLQRTRLHTAACYSCLWNFQWFIVIIQIVCNGPGTCVIFCMAVYIQKLFCLNRTQIVYVESVARCNTLSLSGKLMYLFADKFIVQWPSLKEKYPKAIYLGRLV